MGQSIAEGVLLVAAWGVATVLVAVLAIVYRLRTRFFLFVLPFVLLSLPMDLLVTYGMSERQQQQREKQWEVEGKAASDFCDEAENLPSVRRPASGMNAANVVIRPRPGIEEDVMPVHAAWVGEAFRQAPQFCAGSRALSIREEAPIDGMVQRHFSPPTFFSPEGFELCPGRDSPPAAADTREYELSFMLEKTLVLGGNGTLRRFSMTLADRADGTVLHRSAVVTGPRLRQVPAKCIDVVQDAANALHTSFQRAARR